MDKGSKIPGRPGKDAKLEGEGGRSWQKDSDFHLGLKKKARYNI